MLPKGLWSLLRSHCWFLFFGFFSIVGACPKSISFCPQFEATFSRDRLQRSPERILTDTCGGSRRRRGEGSGDGLGRAGGCTKLAHLDLGMNAFEGERLTSFEA